MNLNDVMDLDVNWKIDLLNQAEEWFDEYFEEMGNKT